MKSTDSLSLSREVMISIGSRVLMAVVGFGGVIVFARTLGDTGVGEYRTVVAVALILSQIPSGIGMAIRKRVSEVDVEPEAFFGVGLLVHIAFTLLTLIAFVLLRPWAVEYFETTALAFGVVLTVFASGLFAVTNSLFAGVGYPGFASWADSIRSVVTLALQLLFIWQGLGAFGVVAGLAGATILTSLLSAVWAGVRPRLPDPNALARTYSFARWSVPNEFIQKAASNVDVLLLKWLAGSGAVGLYTVANTASMPGTMFAGSIRNALAVKSSGVVSAGGDVRADVVNAVSYTCIIAIPLFFGSLAIPNAILVTVFGPEFAGGGLALIGLTLAPIFGLYGSSIEATVEGADLPETAFRMRVIETAVFIPTAAGLGYLYGVVGVVGAVVLKNVIRFGAYQYVAHREFGGLVVTRPMIDQVLAGIGMFLFVDALSRAVPIVSWITLLFVVSCGAVIYFVLLFAVSGHFRETLQYSLPFDVPFA